MLHGRGPGVSENDENRSAPSAFSSTRQTLGRRGREDDEDDDALTWGPRKRPSRTDPLVHYGRHFGRAIYAFCRPFPLIKESLARHLEIESGRLSESEFTQKEKREHQIFQSLLRLSPGLEQRLRSSSDDEKHYIADMINKGANGARSDDTKSLKSVVIDWITPTGGALVPPLSRNIKTDRGFYHYATGQLLCPVSLDWSDSSVRESLRSGEITLTAFDWPLFLYRNHACNPQVPWDGLFRGKLLVFAFKHIFIAPSSVERETRATRSGNAEIHGMTSVTIASIAYVSTMVRFALNSSAVFNRNDRATDSESFYRAVTDFLEEEKETGETDKLLGWWNQTIFPSYHNNGSDGAQKAPMKTVKDMIKEWRKGLRDVSNGQEQPTSGSEDSGDRPGTS